MQTKQKWTKWSRCVQKMDKMVTLCPSILVACHKDNAIEYRSLSVDVCSCLTVLVTANSPYLQLQNRPGCGWCSCLSAPIRHEQQNPPYRQAQSRPCTGWCSYFKTPIKHGQQTHPIAGLKVDPGLIGTWYSLVLQHQTHEHQMSFSTNKTWTAKLTHPIARLKVDPGLVGVLLSFKTNN